MRLKWSIVEPEGNTCAYSILKRRIPCLIVTWTGGSTDGIFWERDAHQHTVYSSASRPGVSRSQLREHSRCTRANGTTPPAVGADGPKG